MKYLLDSFTHKFAQYSYNSPFITASDRTDNFNKMVFVYDDSDNSVMLYTKYDIGLKSFGKLSKAPSNILMNIPYKTVFEKLDFYKLITCYNFQCISTCVDGTNIVSRKILLKYRLENKVVVEFGVGVDINGACMAFIQNFSLDLSYPLNQVAKESLQFLLLTDNTQYAYDYLCACLNIPYIMLQYILYLYSINDFDKIQSSLKHIFFKDFNRFFINYDEFSDVMFLSWC